MYRNYLYVFLLFFTFTLFSCASSTSKTLSPLIHQHANMGPYFHLSKSKRKSKTQKPFRFDDDNEKYRYGFIREVHQKYKVCIKFFLLFVYLCVIFAAQFVYPLDRRKIQAHVLVVDIRFCLILFRIFSSNFFFRFVFLTIILFDHVCDWNFQSVDIHYK